MFKKHLSKLIEIQKNSKYIANRWNMLFFLLSINGGLEDVYVLSNCAYCNHNNIELLM